MKCRVLNGFGVLILSAGVALFHASASAGHLPGEPVKVIPRVSNPVPSSSRPVPSNTRYGSRTTDPARTQNHTSETRNGTRDQSRQTTRQRTDDPAHAQNRTSETRNGTRDQSRQTTRQRTENASTSERHGDAVCTSGNPKLIGVRCSANSECNWGARCVGLPTRCANTGAPCLSSEQCMVPGVCS